MLLHHYGIALTFMIKIFDVFRTLHAHHRAWGAVRPASQLIPLPMAIQSVEVA